MTELPRPPLIDLLTVPEAAPHLRMSTDSLYRLVRERKVPHRRISGIGICFTPDDLKQIVDDALQPPTAVRAARGKRAA